LVVPPLFFSWSYPFWGSSVTKSDLIQAISAKLEHLPARDVEIVINTMFQSMTDSLQKGDRIEIRGFGSFSVRHRRARMGRNPKTGVAIQVPPKRVPFFTVGHELRRRINADFSPQATVDASTAQETPDEREASSLESNPSAKDVPTLSPAILDTLNESGSQPSP